MKTATFLPVRWCRALVASLAGAILLPGAAFAATTDIANAPLFTSAALTVFPNIMFVLDNSGSMALSYLPDAAGDFSSASYGSKSAHCNGLAYDPDTVYALPVNSLGVPVAAPSTSDLAPNLTGQGTFWDVRGGVTVPAVGTPIDITLNNSANGDFAVGDFMTVFLTGSNTKFFAGTVTAKVFATRLTVTLTPSIVAGVAPGAFWAGGTADAVKGIAPYQRYYTYKGTTIPDLAFAYTKTAVGNVPAGTVIQNPFYTQCAAAAATNSLASTNFTAAVVWPGSPEAQNYENWQTFYSTRLEMMRSSMKLAFKSVTDKYRVGYTTINNMTLAGNFLDIADFNQTQKNAFYSKLDNATPGGGTPLRGALSRAGQYFANKMSGQRSDPMQFACQRNFTILSTDGYWNVQGIETSTYGPFQLNNVDPVGQQDGGTTKPPMFDGPATTRQSNTLADIAMYYYQTDLRNPSLRNCTGAPDSHGVTHDVCEDKVPGNDADAYHSFGDSATWQHMTTFTIGLGVAGFLDYDPAYLTSRSGDFDKIVNGELNWPQPDVTACGGCSPPENADDLWHAAVNGRGQYFSASAPGALARGLNAALNSIKGATGSAAAASTSSLQPVAGDNDIFVAQFTTMDWTGEVLSFKINPEDGSIGTTPTWSARSQLDTIDPGTRRIFYSNGGTTPVMKSFTYANLRLDGLNSNVENFCNKPGVASGATAPDQCGTLGSADTNSANSGNNMVNFLRGDQTQSAYYRTRPSRLGDIINASPLFIGKPNFKYTDAGYAAFKTAQAARTAVVLAAANDGMLHAFKRDDGTEQWAFIPSFVIPNLYKLADTNYANNHQFYVDGSPEMGDVFLPATGTWRTIVVGGLNSGGRGYYALDVTDPLNPILLWEFTNTNLGLSYGNPIITKRAGQWVVAFASGYNNADGNGHLFVLDAYTGTLLDDIPTFTSGTTPAGTAGAPSGLARINSWVDADTDNTEKRFYGGDLLGNLWRFTIDGTAATGKGALLLAQFKTSPTVGQAITTKPMLAEVTFNGAKYAVVYVGTGRYLGTSDLSDTTVQSVYAIKDPLSSTGWGDIRARTDLVVRTISTGTDANNKPTRTVAASGTVDWSAKAGWRADFPGSGERVTVNPAEALDQLFIGTNVPSSDSCVSGGTSFLYQFDISTGSGTASYVDQVLVQGLTIVQLVQGASAGAIELILTRADGKTDTRRGGPPPVSNVLHRTSWRELVE